MSHLGWVTQGGYGRLVVAGYPPDSRRRVPGMPGQRFGKGEGVAGGPDTAGVQGQWTGR